MSAQVIQLRYPPGRRPRWRRWRRHLGWAVLLPLTAGLAIVTAARVPSAVEQFRRAQRLHADLGRPVPGTHAVLAWQTDADEAGAPAAADPRFGGTFDTPGPWAACARGLEMPADRIAYLGRRTSWGGTERVVRVDLRLTCWPSVLGRGTDAELSYAADALVVTGTTARSNPSAGLIVPYPGAATVRVLAGQPHPDDASRFSIGVDVAGNRQDIDGRLCDDGTVLLTVRYRP